MIYPVTIYYEDTDLSGFVYHANYLKYFDRAREEAIGMDRMQRLVEEGMGCVVSRLEVRYRQPAQLGDQIEIHTQFEVTRSPRIRFQQRAMRGETPLVEAEIDVVLIDSAGKPIRAPKL